MEVLDKKPLQYDREVAQKIGDMVREGIPINKICASENMPSYHTLSKWRRTHPEMSSILMQARIDRADFFHGLAAETLVNLHNDPEPTMNEIGRARVVMEFGMKLAEVDDPRSYGKNQDDSNPHQTVVIITGVPVDKEKDYGRSIFGRVRELDNNSSNSNRGNAANTAGTAAGAGSGPNPGGGHIHGTSSAAEDGLSDTDFGPGLPDNI